VSHSQEGDSDLKNTLGSNLEIPDDVLCQAVNATILRALPNAALFLGVYYVLITISHQLVLPKPLANIMSAISAASSVLAFLIFAWLKHRTPASAWANPVGACLAGIGLINIIMHAYLGNDPLQFINLMLAMITVGLMIPSIRWFLSVLGLYLVSWLVIIWILPSSPIWTHLIFGIGFAAAVSILAHTLLFNAFKHNEKLHIQSENLLLNILPELIARRLIKNSQMVIADEFSEVTVLFADIVNFTPLSTNMSPHEVVILLNHVFSALDQLADRYGLEKIKTIGDAYMVVGGVPSPRCDHLEAVANMALHIPATLANFATPDGHPLSMRVGIHSGPVVAGVIGIHKFSYDLWGDTVNTASRMEAQGQESRIQVSEYVYEKLKNRYEFEPRGMIQIKGKGPMSTYFLVKAL